MKQNKCNENKNPQKVKNQTMTIQILTIIIENANMNVNGNSIANSIANSVIIN